MKEKDISIVEGNKLIAEFVGFTINEPDDGFPEWKTWNAKNVWQPPFYDFDGKTSHVLVDGIWMDASIPNFMQWDWIMPAIKKFMEIPEAKFNYNAKAMAELRQCKASLKGLSICIPLSDVFNHLLANIQWYNQQSK